MNISPELWRQIDPLLTDAFKMEDGARALWLAALDKTHPQLTPLLRKMLATHEHAERSQELETVPKLAPAPPPSAFAAGARVGAFILVRLLGRGGMGEVWLASQADGRVERQVALKLPTTYEHSEVLRERFRRERDILAKLAHPNIARLFDAGISEAQGSRGQPYLAMEYIEGEALNDFVSTQKSSIDQRLKLFRQILAAVAHAHHHLVVHRDLKPGNILIDQSGQVKLLDFGIAKLLDEGVAAATAANLTQLGGRVMTLRYAAPEQVSDTVISTATDTYALGVILHELLTGLSPYSAVRKGKALTEAALLGEQTAAPSSLVISGAAAAQCKLASSKLLARKIAGDLDAIILKAMRKNPTDRYASVEQFDDDIERHLNSLPVKARAGTWRYLAGRFVARYKLPIAAAAAVLVTLTTGVVMVERERRVAVAEKARAEKHFASVRKLANSFMFEVHREIEPLAGSLKARQILVGTALQYLDNLANEAGNDPALSAELAAAYRKIADIQGQTSAANLGKLSDALVNYEKSKALFVALGNLKANDIAIQREHLLLRYSLARAYVQNGDARWQENIDEVVKLAAHIVTLPNASSHDRLRVPRMLAEQALLTSTMLGQTPAGETTINKAVLKLETMLRESPGDREILSNLASTYQRAAHIFAGNKSTPQSLTHAIEMRKKSIETYNKLASEYPHNQELRKQVALNQMALAVHFAKVRRYAEANDAIESALAQQKTLYASDPQNMAMNADILHTLAPATAIAYWQADLSKAIRYGRAGLSHFAAMPTELQKMLEVRSTRSDVLAYLGLALLAHEVNGTTTGMRPAPLREACALLSESVAFMDQLRASQPGAIDEGDAKEISEGLARCRAQMVKLGSR